MRPISGPDVFVPVTMPFVVASIEDPTSGEPKLTVPMSTGSLNRSSSTANSSSVALGCTSNPLVSGHAGHADGL